MNNAYIGIINDTMSHKPYAEKDEFHFQLPLSSITVFAKEYYAVFTMTLDLGKCDLRSKFKDLPPNVETAFEDVIDKLVQADKLLALHRLEDTSYKKFDDVSGDPETVVKQQLGAAAVNPFAQLRAAHLKDFQALFRRVTIDLGQTEAMKLPTDARIQRFAEGNDPQLAALYFQFGRYLLIASSRPGTHIPIPLRLVNDRRNPQATGRRPAHAQSVWRNNWSRRTMIPCPRDDSDLGYSHFWRRWFWSRSSRSAFLRHIW